MTSGNFDCLEFDVLFWSLKNEDEDIEGESPSEIGEVARQTSREVGRDQVVVEAIGAIEQYGDGKTVSLCAASPDRLIKDKGFPGFFACHWEQGRIYPFQGSPAEGACVENSPISSLINQGYVGDVNMASSYRLVSTFVSGDQVVLGTGTAVAVGSHELITAAHNLAYASNGVPWQLKKVMVLSGEYVPVQKIQSFGFECTVLYQEYSVDTRDGSALCVPTGADIALLSVVETLPAFLVPCSPEPEQLVSSISFPATENFLRLLTEEFANEEEDGAIWLTYQAVMTREVEEFARHCGDFEAAKKLAKKMLLRQFHDVLQGIPEGAQACSAGKIETLTTPCVAHTSPALPGSSGGAVSPLTKPGYMVANQSGGFKQFNVNTATSTDNMVFVRAYVKYVLPYLPPPWDATWSRPFFTVAPFQQWLEKHRLDVPSGSHSWFTGRRRRIEDASTSNKRLRGPDACNPFQFVTSSLVELE